MALIRPPRNENRPLLQGINREAGLVQVGGVTAARAREERVTVNTFGADVTLLNNAHIRTNFFIDQSRPYIPGVKLTKYIYCHCMIICFCFHSLAVFPLPFPPPNVGFPMAIAALIVTIIWLLWLLQHLYVHRRTLFYVLQQPVISSAIQSSLNEFYEFKVERLEGIYLEARQAGIGAVEATSGSITFMAFNEIGVNWIKKAKRRSNTMLFFCCLEVIWCSVWTGLQVHWYLFHNHPLY